MQKENIQCVWLSLHIHEKTKGGMANTNHGYSLQLRGLSSPVSVLGLRPSDGCAASTGSLDFVALGFPGFRTVVAPPFIPGLEDTLDRLAWFRLEVVVADSDGSEESMLELGSSSSM